MTVVANGHDYNGNGQSGGGVSGGHSGAKQSPSCPQCYPSVVNEVSMWWQAYLIFVTDTTDMSV